MCVCIRVIIAIIIVYIVIYVWKVLLHNAQ